MTAILCGCLVLGSLLTLTQAVAGAAGQEPWSRGNPYRKLFEVPAPTTRQVAPLPREITQPRVLCGMKLIPADPRVDPKMGVELKSPDTRYTIRAIPPPVCK